jgi:hypothetical protein
VGNLQVLILTVMLSIGILGLKYPQFRTVGLAFLFFSREGHRWGQKFPEPKTPEQFFLKSYRLLVEFFKEHQIVDENV